MQIGVGPFRMIILESTPGIKSLVVLQFSYMLDQSLTKKMKKVKFQAKIWPFNGPSLPKYKDISKYFTYDQTSDAMY